MMNLQEPMSRQLHNQSTNRRALIQKMFAMGFGVTTGVQVFAEGEQKSPPIVSISEPLYRIPPPLEIEQRIELNKFVLLGIPRRFRYVPQRAFTDYYNRQASDPEFTRLVKTENAPDSAYEKYYAARPVDPKAFRLRELSEINGPARPFLEFEIDRVLFRKGGSKEIQIDAPARRLYFRVAEGANVPGQYHDAWHAWFGKRAIFFSAGPSPQSRGTDYLPYPYLVHNLTSGSHMQDQLPVSIEQLVQVEKAVESVGWIRVEAIR